MSKLCKNMVFKKPYIYLKKVDDYLLKSKSVLYIGIADGEFFIKEFMPVVPENVKVIAVTGTTKEIVDAFAIKYAAELAEIEKTRKITLHVLDLVGKEYSRIDKFDCIISFWDTGVASNLKLAYPRIRVMMKDSGAAIIMIEVRGYFWDAVYNVSVMPEWYPYLNGVVDAIPPTFHNFWYKIDKVLENDEERKYRWSDGELAEYNDFDDYMATLNKMYTFKDYIPAERLRQFYDLIYAETLRLADFDYSTIEVNPPKVTYPYSVAVLILPNPREPKKKAIKTETETETETET